MTYPGGALTLKDLFETLWLSLAIDLRVTEEDALRLT